MTVFRSLAGCVCASLATVLLIALPAAAAETNPAVGADKNTAAKLPPLPEKISSFGAAVVGDALYVYSGHTGGAHEHSRDNLSQRFSRLRLTAPSEWESLPVGPGLQSPSLVAYDGQLYRVGGLSARNAKGEPDDLVSVVDVERFDPKAKAWSPLTSLPVGRSSHDTVVVGNQIYVIGGWNLGREQAWHDRALTANLSQAKLEWKELPPQPFKRRALAVAEVGGKIYAIGGMSETGPSLDVHVFDIQTQQWSEGPKVPSGNVEGHGGMGGVLNGFGCSAFNAGGKLYLSTMDGSVFRLADDGKKWDAVAKLTTPRFFHRLLPHGRQLLAVGGASRGGHLDSIEIITPEAAKTK